MPQNTNPPLTGKGPSAPVPVAVDSLGRIRVISEPNGALATRLNLTAATLVKATPGTIVSVSVIVAGTAPGSVNDATTVGAAATANEVAVIPNTVGAMRVDFPCLAGIVVTPGAGQTVSVAFV